MTDDKKFYWIKLRTDFFNQETIDFLLSQKNGAEYVVLYQMLILQTANNKGELSMRVGEMIVPYTIEKISRDTKYFDIDTVAVALELYKKLGLIYKEKDGTLLIEDISNMVGSESGNKEAIKKRIYRAKQKELEMKRQTKGQVGDKMSDRDRDRDKSIEIEYRVKSIDTIREIVDYLNMKTGKNFRHQTKNTRTKINARLNEGFNIDDFKTVIDKQTNKWLDDQKMNDYLRPETLFGTKFEGYLNSSVSYDKKSEVNDALGDLYNETVRIS